MYMKFLVALVFCGTAMMGQVNAQCSGNYSSYYQPSSYSSASSCSNYLPASYASSFNQPAYYNGYSSNFRTASATKLPTPDFAQQISTRPASLVRSSQSYVGPVVNAVPQTISSPAPSNIYSSFNSSFNGYLNYARPTCAGGNCPYR